MSPVFHWLIHAEQLARTLVATLPSHMDLVYGDLAASFIDDRPLPVDESRLEGTWLKCLSGYAFIGPPGGAHFFTPTCPEEVSDQAMAIHPTIPAGRLFAAVREALNTAQRLASGEEVEVTVIGFRCATVCPAEYQEAVRKIQICLDAALTASQPNYNRTVLRQHAGLLFSSIGSHRSPFQVARAFGAAAMDLREQYAMDAWLFAVVVVRARLAESLPTGTRELDRLIGNSFDGAGSGYDAEAMLMRIVLDYVGAGHLDLVMQILEEALDLARINRQQALAANSVSEYFSGLSRAAAFGFTAWVLSDLVLNRVPRQGWPPNITAQKLSGYNATAEETAVRASIALGIGCINTGTRAALNRHISVIRERGPAWADELIEEHWYYPRCLRPTLIGEFGAS